MEPLSLQGDFHKTCYKNPLNGANHAISYSGTSCAGGKSQGYVNDEAATTTAKSEKQEVPVQIEDGKLSDSLEDEAFLQAFFESQPENCKTFLWFFEGGFQGVVCPDWMGWIYIYIELIRIVFSICIYIYYIYTYIYIYIFIL